MAWCLAVPLWPPPPGYTGTYFCQKGRNTWKKLFVNTQTFIFLTYIRQQSFNNQTININNDQKSKTKRRHKLCACLFLNYYPPHQLLLSSSFLLSPLLLYLFLSITPLYPPLYENINFIKPKKYCRLIINQSEGYISPGVYPKKLFVTNNKPMHWVVLSYNYS